MQDVRSITRHFHKTGKVLFILVILSRNDYFTFVNLRLPDQPLMQLEPPTKKAKLSKSRVAAPAKSVAKQSKNVHQTSQSTGASSSSGIQTEPQRRVCSTSNNNDTDSNAATSSSGVAQKQKSGVEKVIVGQPMYNGDIRGNQFVTQWDPYVMVETVSNVRLFPGHPMIDSGAYMASPVNTSSHVGMSGLRMTNLTSFPAYGSPHTSPTKGESSQQSARAKGYFKKGGFSLTGKDKGSQKGKAVATKGKRSYQKNKDRQSLLSDVPSSQSSSHADSDSNKQTKSFGKSMMRTGSSGRGENSRQKRQHGESSRGHSSRRVWPTIPNLDYSSGKQLQVTFNNESVFITQYKLLK